jgi:hypothetical protein
MFDRLRSKILLNTSVVNIRVQAKTNRCGGAGQCPGFMFSTFPVVQLQVRKSGLPVEEFRRENMIKDVDLHFEGSFFFFRLAAVAANVAIRAGIAAAQKTCLAVPP